MIAQVLDKCQTKNIEKSTSTSQLPSNTVNTDPKLLKKIRDLLMPIFLNKTNALARTGILSIDDALKKELTEATTLTEFLTIKIPSQSGKFHWSVRSHFLNTLGPEGIQKALSSDEAYLILQDFKKNPTELNYDNHSKFVDIIQDLYTTLDNTRDSSNEPIRYLIAENDPYKRQKKQFIDKYLIEHEEVNNSISPPGQEVPKDLQKITQSLNKGSYDASFKQAVLDIYDKIINLNCICPKGLANSHSLSLYLLTQAESSKNPKEIEKYLLYLTKQNPDSFSIFNKKRLESCFEKLAGKSLIVANQQSIQNMISSFPTPTS